MSNQDDISRHVAAALIPWFNIMLGHSAFVEVGSGNVVCAECKALLVSLWDIEDDCYRDIVEEAVNLIGECKGGTS